MLPVRSVRLGAVLVVMLSLAGLGPSAASAAGTTHKVTMDTSQAYHPSALTIERGDTVQWKNTSIFTAHDVASGLAGYFTSGTKGGMGQGDTYTRTFKQAGTFGYLCRVHPGMNGSISVPIKVARSGDTFTITVASATSSNSWKNRLQVQKPGSSAWTTITTTTSRTVSWSSSRHGTFRFRSAVRSTSTGALSGWSQVVAKTR